MKSLWRRLFSSVAPFRGCLGCRSGPDNLRVSLRQPYRSGNTGSSVNNAHSIVGLQLPRLAIVSEEGVRVLDLRLLFAYSRGTSTSQPGPRLRTAPDPRLVAGLSGCREDGCRRRDTLVAPC